MHFRGRVASGCLLLLTFAPGVAQACRCRPSTFAARADRAQLIVLARVVRTMGDSQVVLLVEERFKGMTASDTLTLRRSDSSCEFFPRTPDLGARYLLLVPLRDGPTGASQCSGSGVVEERAAELQWLRSRRPPDGAHRGSPGLPGAPKRGPLAAFYFVM